MTPPTDPALDAFDYALPPDRIAQHPSRDRDGGRLLVLDRNDGALRHARVRSLPELLAPGDLVVVNATRVLPARLRGHKATGGAVEALVLGPADAPGAWRVLLRGRVRVGAKLCFRGAGATLDAEVTALVGDGEARLQLPAAASPYALGEMPLPPYIRRGAPDPEDAARYQTVFAREPGSVAAPTAGLHLSRALLADLERAGIARAEVVLHVGPGTFRPPSPADLARGRLHPEPFSLPEATARRIARTRARGARVVAVGTTTARVLETRATREGGVRPGRGTTDLFLRPGSSFRVVDALLTNFHLPRSSLLLLVAAFGGRERVRAAYAEALRAGYRFASYGDAMLLR